MTHEPTAREALRERVQAFITENTFYYPDGHGDIEIHMLGLVADNLIAMVEADVAIRLSAALDNANPYLAAYRVASTNEFSVSGRVMDEIAKAVFDDTKTALTTAGISVESEGEL